MNHCCFTSTGLTLLNLELIVAELARLKWVTRSLKIEFPAWCCLSFSVIGLREKKVSQEEPSIAPALKSNVNILLLIRLPREKQLQQW